MIKDIKNILNEKYNILENDGKVMIFSAGVVYPEDYIEVVKEKGKYLVNQVNRASVKSIIWTEEEKTALLSACVLAIRLFDPLERDQSVDTLKAIAKSGEIEKARAFLEKIFPPSIYVIGKEESEKVSLVIHDTCADVMFQSEYLAQDASLPRSFAVMYNYCKKMLFIQKWFQENNLTDDGSFGLALCEKLYLLGKS